MSLARSGVKNPNSIPVVQLNKDGVYITRYNTLREANAVTGVAYQSISKVCRGKLKTAGGYLWKYERDLKEVV